MSANERTAQLGITNDSGCWPTPNQELLLRAALLSGSDALKAWRDWRTNANLDAIDFGSHRLLPQLYRNLLAHGISDPILSNFASVYRYYWYKNEVLFHQAAALIKSLAENHIETMVLKGAALIPLCYRDSALRPMQDFDLMVPPSKVKLAMELLERAGWRSRFGSPEKRIPIRHSTAYRNNEAQEIDLHWHVLGECWNFNRDEIFWRTSVPLTIVGQQTRTLDPTNQLFHICSHGVEWNEVPPIRWIADALIVLRVFSSEIDWIRLPDVAKRHHLSLPLHKALSYLQRNFQVSIPTKALAQLQEAVKKIDSFGYRLKTEPIAQPTTTEILRRLRYTYLWLTSDTPLWRRPALFALWCQHQWGFESQWQLFRLPYRALLRLIRPTVRHVRKIFVEPTSPESGGSRRHGWPGETDRGVGFKSAGGMR